MEIILILLSLFIGYWLINVPVNIAKKKNIKENDIFIIKILSYCGIFFGITWFIALFLSLFWNNYQDISNKSNIDEIEKAYNLFEKNIISKEEFEKIKKRNLKE